MNENAKNLVSTEEKNDSQIRKFWSKVVKFLKWFKEEFIKFRAKFRGFMNTQLQTFDELEKIYSLTAKINDILKDMFLKSNIRLIDFKLEFGRYNGDIVLADEISPDTCRFWDATTGEKLDKDRFRRDLGNVKDAYVEILKRIQE